MLVQEILNIEIAPVQPEDTIGLALSKLETLHVTKLPVVESGKLIGMISLENLIAFGDDNVSISKLSLEDSISIDKDVHVFEATRRMLLLDLHTLPVTNSSNDFLGVIKKTEILEALSELLNLEAFGSVLTIEMTPYDFTLSELVRIIEIEDAKIMGIAVQKPNEHSDFYRISVKLNIEDSSAVSSALQRYGYVVTSQFSSSTMEKDFSDRADELIRYLDL